MVLIDISVQEQKGANVFKFKVSARHEDSLSTVVKKALEKFLQKQCNPAFENVDCVLKRVRLIASVETDLTDLLNEPEATIFELNSCETPTSKGFVIKLNAIHPINASCTPTKKPRKLAVEVLMGRAVTDMRYLSSDVNLEKETDLQQQLMATLYLVWKKQGLGFCNGDQEAQLRLNTKKIVDTMCFIQKHWRVLLRADFPDIPETANDGYHSSVLLNKLGGLKRMGESYTK